MPSLSRRLPPSRPAPGDDAGRPRVDHLDPSLIPLAPEYTHDYDQAGSYGSQFTAQESYQLHGMGVPHLTQDKRRGDTVKRKDKAIPSRSQSRSFGSFFGSGRKKILGIDSDTDSSDGDGFGTSSAGPSSAARGKRAVSALEDEPSFETGTCMTCNAKVRWPKGLKLYRCTICHCINDLEPRPQKELRKVKEVDQSTWRKLNTRYPGLKFPDAPYFALAAREARDIADRCMQTYVEAISGSNDHMLGPRGARRPSADAGTSLGIRRKPLPITTPADRRPSANALPPLRAMSPLLTPPHLTDLQDPFNFIDGHSSSPEITASPRTKLPWPTDERSRAKQDGSPRSVVPPAPVREPPPLPDTNKFLPEMAFDPAKTGGNTLQESPGGRDARRTNRDGPSSSERLKAAFSPLEAYLRWSYACFDSLNNAFSTVRPQATARTRSEGATTMPPVDATVVQENAGASNKQAWHLSEVNGKTLLVGDVAENATLWTGAVEDGTSSRNAGRRKFLPRASTRLVTHRSPCIHWENARDWYGAVLGPGQRWQQKRPASSIDVAPVQLYLEKLLHKASESLLRRPGRPLQDPEDIRFLLVMLANPLLYQTDGKDGGADKPPAICKRILGLLARSGKRALRYLDGWLVNLDNTFYQDVLDLCKRYMHYRLLRDVVSDESRKNTGLTGDSVRRDAARQQTQRAQVNIDGDTESGLSYFDDWGLGSAGAFMFSMWTANLSRPSAVRLPGNSWYNLFFDSMGEAAIKQDFTAWEARKPAFAFCYFPFIISMSAKITILTFDANRQQMDEARKAWQQQFNTSELVSQNFHVHVRRECLAVDSLRSISEAAGGASHHKELKKGLRIHFEGEDGVDAGGLRKEFFLLLLRELLDPNHGLVEYDEQSNYCYFNPNTFEESAQYFLLGTLIGLAIYNGTILDIPFPPLLFKKLLRRDSGVGHGEGDALGATSNATDYSLEDFAQWRPSLAHGFRQLLEYDGNVEEDLNLTFTLEYDRFGILTSVPLAGKTMDTPVTKDNRVQYVRAYMSYLMHDSVSRQFEPFKRGFFAVCGGNALSLFQPEELELLVRGSDEALDVDVLRAVSVCEGWSLTDPADTELVVRWFWDFFASLGYKDQRRLLGFITGSDRVPALGEANLIIKLQYGGEDRKRLPVARTCFNALQLHAYASEQELREKLWQAVTESEGFLLK